MQKILVIGSPGAGKSTFARALRTMTGIPLYYLDMIWHRPDQTNCTREEFDAALDDILRRDRWIVDGNYQRTLEVRLKVCDTVFLLDYPLEICLAGAQSRIGRKREDLPWVESAFDAEFEQWILDFPRQQRPEMLALLERYRQGREIVILNSRAEGVDCLGRLGRWYAAGQFGADGSCERSRRARNGDPEA